MKMVNIVCKRPTADRIIPYKARLLRDACGYGLSESANSAAAWNYYFPYADAPKELAPTFTAAYFTHKDESNPMKLAKWEEMAATVDLRICSSDKYLDELRQYGRCAKALPPIEFDKFVIAPQRNQGVPRVGLSGFCYGDGRKGEALVAQLAQSLLGQTVHLTASGRGWPVETIGYARADLPRYYQSLDVFLCSSTLEGIPMTILEAMACGVRCVIPMHVGIIDELPYIPDLFRYTAGDYRSMEVAVEAALVDLKNTRREELRAAVAPYSIANWAQGHREAFSNA